MIRFDNPSILIRDGLYWIAAPSPIFVTFFNPFIFCKEVFLFMNKDISTGLPVDQELIEKPNEPLLIKKN